MKINWSDLTAAVSIVLIGVVSLWGANTSTKYPPLRIGNYQILAYDYSLTLINSDHGDVVYTVSPYDDLIHFADGQWRGVIRFEENLKNTQSHEIKRSDQLVIRNILGVFGRTDPKFTARGDYEINYTARRDGQSLWISKAITGLSSTTATFTSCLLTGTEDFVFDSNGDISYHRGKLAELPLALQEDLTSIGEQNEGKEICYIGVTNLGANGLLIIPLKRGEWAEFDAAEKKLKVHTMLDSTSKEVKLDQEIKIFDRLKDFTSSEQTKCQ